MSATPRNPDDPAAHMTEQVARYAALPDGELSTLLRQYAIAPEGFTWTERAALLYTIAERLDTARAAGRRAQRAEHAAERWPYETRVIEGLLPDGETAEPCPGSGQPWSTRERDSAAVCPVCGVTAESGLYMLPDYARPRRRSQPRAADGAMWSGYVPQHHRRAQP